MLKPPRAKFDYLLEESYLAFIKNSVGSKSYRTFLVRKGGRPFDVLGKGDVSCAFFVSAVLYLFKRIKEPGFTVARTAEKLLAGGAKRVPLAKLKAGDVLIWVPTKEKTGPHNHIGFYVGNGKAVSNNAKKGLIVNHHYLYHGKRQVELALRPDWKKPHAKS
jgi:hypothetical protein